MSQGLSLSDVHKQPELNPRLEKEQKSFSTVLGTQRTREKSAAACRSKVSKEQSITMKSLRKFSLITPVTLISLALAACSGVRSATNNGGGSSGGGGTTGPYSIGGTVTGLTSGDPMTLQNNGGDALVISSSGNFTFKTPVVINQPYLVTVSQPPATPPQTCTVSGGSGTAKAQVTTVAVTCTTGTEAIGVTVNGLSGTGLVLQNGTEFLPITGATTTNQFKTAIPFGQTYNVTVSTQPSGPTQTCTVANGSGTSTTGVAINVQITCSNGTVAIGGSVSDFAGGTGFILQDNGGDNLTITKNGTFTFPTLIPAATKYNVTISSQPSGPNQKCTVTFGQGTTGPAPNPPNIINVAVACQPVTHVINVDVVGVLGTSGSMQLQDNGGDNLMTPSNGPYQFATAIAHGSFYDVSVFVAPGTQPEGCYRWGWSGTALSDPVNPVPLIDCGHNDWTWMAGTDTADQFGKTTNPPPACPPVDTDTPGGTSYSSTWTDLQGNLWLLTGYGFTSSTPQPSVLPGFFNELWEFTGTANYEGGCGNFWTRVTPTGTSIPSERWGAITWTDPGTGNLWLFGGQDASLAFLNDLWEFNIAAKTWTYLAGGANLHGVYGTQGTPAAGNLPGGRWGASARRDPATGLIWLFGGFGCDSTIPSSGCSNLLLNDLWSFDGTNWTWFSGSNIGDSAGTYGAQGTAAAGNVPPARQASVAWIDNNSNFWMFGGFTGGTNGFNDLWKFDTTAKQWTWMNGSKGATSTPSNYGLQGVAASTNVPGARWLSAAWSDTHGNLWVFGGEGFDTGGFGSLGDLWEYALSTTTDPGNPSTVALNQWTWIKGPDSISQPGNYGVAPNPTVWPHVTNLAGTRWAPAYWTTSPVPNVIGQAFWMFGGEGFDSSSSTGKLYSLLNDLWRYLPYQ
jgi:Galactose oxidase, central domain